MKSIKRIVVGIDFSDFSPRILKFAVENAKRLLAEIVVVNVIDERRIKDTIQGIHDEEMSRQILESYVHDEAEKRKMKMSTLIKSWVSKEVAYREIIRTGVPFEELLKVIDEEDADLVIINSRGRSNFQDYMFGTTAEKVFRYCPTSLLSLNLVD